MILLNEMFSDETQDSATSAPPHILQTFLNTTFSYFLNWKFISTARFEDVEDTNWYMTVHLQTMSSDFANVKFTEKINISFIVCFCLVKYFSPDIFGRPLLYSKSWMDMRTKITRLNRIYKHKPFFLQSVNHIHWSWIKTIIVFHDQLSHRGAM